AFPDGCIHTHRWGAALFVLRSTFPEIPDRATLPSGRIDAHRWGAALLVFRSAFPEVPDRATFPGRHIGAHRWGTSPGVAVDHVPVLNQYAALKFRGIDFLYCQHGTPNGHRRQQCPDDRPRNRAEVGATRPYRLHFLHAVYDDLCGLK